MKYEAKWWAKLLQKVEQVLPRKFDYTRPGAPSHPWQITSFYHKKQKRWLASLLPGLVNGLPAYITMIYQDAPKEAQERIDKEREEQKKGKAGPNDSVSVYLDEGAQIGLTRFTGYTAGAP